MALQVNYKITYGEIKYRQASNNKLYTIKIHSANALCALIYHYKKDGEKWSRLVTFFANEQHIKNFEKELSSHDCLDLFNGKITSIKLNLYYKRRQHSTASTTKEI